MLINQRVLIGFASIALSATVAIADNPVSWSIDETLTRDEPSKFWTSPTAVDLGFDAYNFGYEITRVRVTAGFVTLDLTDQIAESVPLVGTGQTGPPPLVLIDEALADPTSGTTADVFIEIDSQGFGQAAFTNIMLGTVEVFGLPVNINAVRFEATITAEGIALGDYDGDGDVDSDDYQMWSGAFGSPGGVLSDGNNDGIVDAADYTVWRDSLVTVTPPAVPEPIGLHLTLIAGLGCVMRRARR